MSKTELLKVLDMSEGEQWEWICKNQLVRRNWDHHWYYGKQIICCIADLAFRLRDEADDTRMHNAMFKVQNRISKKTNSVPIPEDYATAFWGLYHAKPIHWIIAALIAKGA